MAVQSRPPVVAFMGHVDHGKTSLLDAIRKSKVAAGEQGGITQHIGAYQASSGDRLITFIDTPGHEAFSKMRSRGAQVTDIVVLVISATEGIKPQTVESLQHIKKAGVQFLVAMNKMDLPEANPDLVKSQLAEHEVIVEDYGGETVVVPVSAKKGEGIDKLLEMILLLADMQDLQADPQGEFEAVVIESEKDTHRGAIGTVLVKNGTLQIGDKVFIKGVESKIRAMFDHTGKQVKVAGPSVPVQIIGWKEVPPVGMVVRKTQEEVAEKPQIVPSVMPSSDGQNKIVLVLKSDTAGTLEAIEQSLTEEVDVVSKGVGEITDQDILVAEATGARVIGFDVKASSSVKKLAETHGIKVKTYSIIYDLLEDLQKEILKLIDPSIDEVELGKAQVAAIFDIRGDRIAGCKVLSGEITKNQLCHVKRNNEIIADPKIASLKRGKEDIESAKQGTECGIVFTRYKDLQVGDEIVTYKLREE